jgi:hypothetical protein
MDPRLNPFAPGAGTQPPELAGRAQVLADVAIALARTKRGRSPKSQMLLGLRGVGKTVLLNRIAEMAEAEEFSTVVLEAPESRRLAAMLVPPLRSTLFRMSFGERAKEQAKRALGVLRAFASAFKVSAGDVEFGVAAEQGRADSGALDHDLTEVLTVTAQAAKENGTGLALLIDEVQYLGQEDLAALIVAVHRVGQKGLPFILFGAGLPQLAALAGEAKSYSERLFEYPDIGPLSDEAAAEAIREPVRREGAEVTDEALLAIVSKTRGYPYFLQEWGYQSWNLATGTRIEAQDVSLATAQAVQRLDRDFFRVRFDRLTPREKDYARAMAQLGPGPHRSGEIAQVLGIEVTTAGPLRTGLIKKGMIYSPQHGDTAFTVPMFDEFMRRSMPHWQPEGSLPSAQGRATRRR